MKISLGLSVPPAAWIALGLIGAATAAPAAPSPEFLTIDAAAGPAARFDPDLALGAALDGMDQGGVAALFTPYNLRRMKSAGLGALTYRLRTELAIEAWHWGEEGAWSDPRRRQGYWTSTDHPVRPVLSRHGVIVFPVGETRSTEAANDGYSRLDDGDPRSFRKSNPYLDPTFTGHSPAHPQWAVAAFPADVDIDAARIRWGAPFARRFDVQYWTGVDEYDDQGRWSRTFPHGAVFDGQGGETLIRLSDAPIESTIFSPQARGVVSFTAPGRRRPKGRHGICGGRVEPWCTRFARAPH